MRWLFSGGGTLGSVTPLLAIVEAAKQQDSDSVFLWVGTKTGPEKIIVEQDGIEFVGITSGRLRRFLAVRNLATPFLVLKGLIDSCMVLRRFRPDVVVSAGGFVAVPVTWAAWFLKIPVHIHQLDWRPGLANKLSAPFAKSISVTFEKSRKDFSNKNVFVTGNPIRQFLFGGSAQTARETFGLQEGIPTVLVLGGGTGAVNLNRLIVEALPKLDGIQILHLTGAGKRMNVPGAPSTYHQVEFLSEEMPDAYAVASLVVTRAGMGTLTELAALGLPAIVVPIPHSHQEDNARLFTESGGAVQFDERAQGADLATLTRELLEDTERRRAMSAAMSLANSREAALNLTRILLSHES